MRKGYLETIWNGVCLENEEERDDLEILGCMKREKGINVEWIDWEE